MSTSLSDLNIKIAEALNLPTGPYAEDISSAWLVVEKLRERYSNVVLHGANGWGVSLGNITGTNGSETWIGPFNAATAPEAICRAGLRAVGVEVA